MAAEAVVHGESGSFLLGLLVLCGWRIRITRGTPTTIRATRNDVVLEVTEPSLSQAAGVMFARAMRSGRARAAA